MARPPLARDRLEELPDRRLAYRLKTPWRDGTTHVVMERHELLERLAPLIPPPRAHQVRYHGVLAPCASGRDRVVPGRMDGEGGQTAVGTTTMRAACVQQSGSTESTAGGTSSGDRPPQRPVGGGAVGAGTPPPGISANPLSASLSAASPSEDHDPGSLASKKAAHRRRADWADLLQRVFEVDALRCPACGGRMRILSAIGESDVARRTLEWLDMPSRAPALGKPKGEPDEGPREESTPDLAGDDVPGFDFDQSPPSDD